MDELPVDFAEKLVKREDTRDISSSNESLRHLIHMIRGEGGYRFWHRRSYKQQDSHRHQYYCSQDVERKRSSTTRGIRDIRTKDLFHCESNLRISLSFEYRTVSIKLHHLPHRFYEEVALTESVKAYVDRRAAAHTPAEIFRDVVSSGCHGSELVTSGQVYYRWQQMNSTFWRLHVDPIVSATQLLSRYPNDYEYCSLGQESGITGLAFFPKVIIRAAREAKELAMDSTFGTNSAGMELYGVLAEIDGAGYPIAYCFVTSKSGNSGLASGMNSQETFLGGAIF